MAIRPVLTVGVDSLLRPSAPVTEIHAPEIAELIQDLTDTQHHLDGAGIAAPQIGVNLQVVTFGFEHNDRYGEIRPVPFTVLINPGYEPLTEEKDIADEGCLSVPNFFGPVARFTRIRYWGITPDGKAIEQEASDFHARVVQHELDHLTGTLFIHKLAEGWQYPQGPVDGTN